MTVHKVRLDAASCSCGYCRPWSPGTTHDKPPAYWDQACRELSDRDPVMRDVIRTHRDHVLRGSGAAFRTLANAVVGQQISVAAAAGIWRRLQATLPDFSPEAVGRSTPEALRAAGLSRRKVEYLHGIAEAFASGEIDASGWADMTKEELRDHLVALRGVGRWTADMVLIFHERRPDVLPLGDLGLVNAAARLYGWDGTVAEKKEHLREHAEIWRPWRTVATWYIWLELDAEPVIY